MISVRSFSSWIRFSPHSKQVSHRSYLPWVLSLRDSNCILRSRREESPRRISPVLAANKWSRWFSQRWANVFLTWITLMHIETKERPMRRRMMIMNMSSEFVGVTSPEIQCFTSYKFLHWLERWLWEQFIERKFSTFIKPTISDRCQWTEEEVEALEVIPVLFETKITYDWALSDSQFLHQYNYEKRERTHCK